MPASLDKSRLTPFAGAGASTVLVLALVDSGIALARGASLGAAAMGMCFGVTTGLWVFGVPLLGLAVWSLLMSAEGPAGLARVRASACAFVLALVVAHGWLVLAQYPAFATSFSLGVAYVLELGFVVAAARIVARTRTVAPRLSLGVVSVVGVVGGLVVHFANGFVFRGLYPEMHASFALVACTLVMLGMVAVFHLRALPPARAVGLALSVALLGGAGSVLASTGFGRSALPDYLDLTVLGSTSDLLAPPADELAPFVAPRFGPDDVPSFAERAGLPHLRNAASRPTPGVLFVSIEAMRWDQTSLADPALETTPNLRRLAEDAFVYSNARSPSSGTLLSMGSMLRMAPASAANIELWDRSWHGELKSGPTSVAQEFASAGWKTIAVTHDHRQAFSECLLGFDAGFDVVERVPADEASVDVDEEIATRTLSALETVNDAPFFAWTFFVSPHFGYVPHDPDAPAKRPLDVYRQELAYADAQLGRLLDGLESAGLAERTIVIVVGDHGEEFFEHGGQRHKASVYEEVSHVPLVVRIPGQRGKLEGRPTSLAYVFPWLLSELQVGSAAGERITELFLPLMHATEGAVLVELFGHERTQSALVWPDQTKLIFDFRSLRHQMFDLAQDPHERRNIAGNATRAAPKLEALQAYRAWRREHKNSSQDPTKSCRRPPG